MRKITFILSSICLVLTSACGNNNTTKSDELTIQFIPKVRQEAFWNAVEAGATKAAEDLKVKLNIQGDPAGSSTPVKQAQYVESATALGVDAIVFAAIDANTTDNALQEAMAAGIKVIGFDSDPGSESRGYFVNQADPTGIAEAVLDDMAEQMTVKGYTAENPAIVYIVSTNPTTPNQNTWIEHIKKIYFSNYEIAYDMNGAINFRASKENTKNNIYTVNDKYSMLVVKVDPDADIIYGGDDYTTSKTQVANKLTANPNIDGIIVLTTNGIAATYDSIREKRLNTVFNGLAVPTDSKAYLESGIMSKVVLWQAYDLGYLAVETAVQELRGNITGDRLVSGLSGKAQVEGASVYPAEGHKIVGTEVILGNPAIFDFSTADKFKK
ncbi:MAG: substrate-binding domain-containing protein [Brevinema sp.]